MNNKSLLRNYLIYLLKKGEFKKIKNLLWVYPLWINYPIRTFIVSKVFPLLNKILKEPYPPFIEIEHTTKCPFKCIICEHTYWKQPSINMNFTQFKHIVDQLPHLKWIGLTGIGESFSNPHFLDMLEYLNQKSKPIIEIVDNMYMMTPERSMQIIKANVDILFISVQGVSKEVNETMFGQVMEFEIFENNLKAFFKNKKKYNSFTPIVNFHYILSKPNKNEAINFMDFVANLNEDVYEILYTPLLHSFPQIKKYIVSDEEIKELKDKIINYHAKKGFHFKIDFNEFIKYKKPISTCSNWIMPFIFVSGDINVCCTTNEANNRDRQIKYSLGNVFDKTIKEIWYGNEYQKFRSLLRKNILPNQCKGCPTYYGANGTEARR